MRCLGSAVRGQISKCKLCGDIAALVPCNHKSWKAGWQAGNLSNQRTMLQGGELCVSRYVHSHLSIWFVLFEEGLVQNELVLCVLPQCWEDRKWSIYLVRSFVLLFYIFLKLYEQSMFKQYPSIPDASLTLFTLTVTLLYLLCSPTLALHYVGFFRMETCLHLYFQMGAILKISQKT